MKAQVYRRYGSTKNLVLEEVPDPKPKDDEVLVRIKAASINSWDWDLIRGKPFMVRLAGGGLFRPIKKIIGCDIAGEVIKVGSDVTDCIIGDQVFGDISRYGWGGFAEYVAVGEEALTKKPESITFSEAASIPQAGVMALQGVTRDVTITKNSKVLIIGAGGGVGTFALQIAKHMGAHVTCVDKGTKFDFLYSLGADRCYAYRKDKYMELGEKYDLIIDVIGIHALSEYNKILDSGGSYNMVGGSARLMI